MRTHRVFLDIPVATLATGAVLIVLNSLLSLYVWVPVGEVGLAFAPIIESLAVLWLMVAASRLAGRAKTIALIAVGGFAGISIGFSASEAFFRFYFARAFRPRGDIGMIRGALLLFFGDIGSVADVLTPIVIALIFLALAALGAGICVAGARLLQTLAHPVGGMVVVTIVAIPIMLSVGLPASLTGGVTFGWIARDEQFIVGGDAPAETPADAPADGADEAQGGQRAAYAFPGLLDRDIYVFAVEAYGYATVARPELAEQIDPYRNELQSVLRDHGYEVRSSYLESPVAGGYSWLAEATLLTGRVVNSQERFLKLYDANLPTLSGMLHQGGYYTLTIRPGTVHGPWPEGWDLYRFQESIVAHEGDFGFEGPWFSYVPITDQYAIWTGDTRIRELTAEGGEAEGRPVLAWYQMVSSHTPYNAIPPVIERWDDLGDGSIYNRRSDEIQRFDNTWTGGTELEEGFVAAIGYVFTVLTDYVDSVLNHDRSPILIIFGDHQPQRPIRSPNAFLSVPIHVASQDPSVLERFEAHGFEPGMKSDAEPPHPHMATFFETFATIAGGTDPVPEPGGGGGAEAGAGVAAPGAGITESGETPHAGSGSVADE